MTQEPTPSEKYVHALSRETFLRLWCYLSPRGKKPDKELCDILVVCDLHIIIISVKEINYKDSGRPDVDRARWEREAIDISISQISGAERWLKQITYVTTKTGERGIDLPDPKSRIIHRIAIAFGSKQAIPLLVKNSFLNEKAFVHILDETSTSVLFHELDTILDFVGYLEAKEKFLSRSEPKIVVGREENLLAIYLKNNRTFPNTDMLIMLDGLWCNFRQLPEYMAKNECNRDSYIWDNLINHLGRDIINNNLEISPSPSEAELTARTLAKEDRFARRILGKAFAEFLMAAENKKIRSRCLQSPSGVIYVFLAADFSTPREDRIAELGCRCHASITRFSGNTVVGIATEVPGSAPKPGQSFDFVYLHADKWDQEDMDQAKSISSELGYFNEPLSSDQRIDEYPVSD